VKVSQILDATGYACVLLARPFQRFQHVHQFSLRNFLRSGALPRLLPALVLTVLAGCQAAPLPDLKPPVPQAWRNAAVSPANPAQPDLRNWWLAFNDPYLNSLVQRALDNNLGVAAATERVIAARTLYKHANDKYLPTLKADTNQVIEPNASASYFIAGFDALWEFPFFGALKSTDRIANGTLDATHAQLQSAYVTLVADVVRCWVELRTAQQQAQQLAHVRDAYREKLRLLQVREGLKLASPADVANAEAELARAEMALSDPQRAINANAQQLAVLLGQPEPDTTWLDEAGPQPQLGNWQLTSAPPDMLRTRPEIAAAEAEVLRAAGEAGIARADVYPHIGLGASLDWSLTILSHHNVFRSGDGIFGVGPVVDMPLFDWGMRVAQSHAKYHELQAAVYDYRQAVLQGVAESETAMGDLQQLHLKETAAEQAAQALSGNATVLDKRRRLGLSSTLDVQDALIAQQNAQLALISARGERDLAYVSLYKALGGAPLPPIRVADAVKPKDVR
jgi:outer membrane protein, multidrug efflux system